MGDPGDVTRILRDLADRRQQPTDALLRAVYGELRTLARQRMAQERAGHTWQPTDLVHEAYMRLLGNEPATWENRAHFFGAAAEAMRRLLVEHARRSGRQKRGGDRRRIDLDKVGPQAADVDQRVIEVDEALQRLESIEPAKAALVKLRYFAGLPLPEAAEILGISRATAARHWAFARAWLYDAMNDPPDAPGDRQSQDGSTRSPEP